MKFVIEDEIEEIEPVGPSEDRCIIHDKKNGGVVPVYSELEKELTAIDVIDGMTTRDAAKIHAPEYRAAGNYAHGQSMEEETRARVLNHRYNIQDIAVTKLMDTLNLLDPSAVDKQRDLISIATGLSQVVDKISEKGTNTPQVHLHLYGPKQNDESDYKVIDV